MKKIIGLTTICCFAAFILSAQSKWFITATTGASVGGPASSIKKKMVDKGWNDTEDVAFIFISWSNEYPIVSRGVSVLVSGGKKISEGKSIFFTAGLADQAEVEGFKNEGYSNLLFIGASYGRYISAKYKVWQVAGGYEYSYPKSKFRLGFGPSIFIYDYKYTAGAESKTSGSTKKGISIAPGVVGTARLPLGKGKRKIGMEAFSQLTLALPAKMDDFTMNNSSDKMGVNMMQANLGVALTLRGK